MCNVTSNLTGRGYAMSVTMMEGQWTQEDWRERWYSHSRKKSVRVYRSWSLVKENTYSLSLCVSLSLYVCLSLCACLSLSLTHTRVHTKLTHQRHICWRSLGTVPCVVASSSSRTGTKHSSLLWSPSHTLHPALPSLCICSVSPLLCLSGCVLFTQTNTLTNSRR